MRFCGCCDITAVNSCIPRLSRPIRNACLQLEVTLTKKSPADWPELEGTGAAAAAAAVSHTRPAVSEKAPDASKPVAEPPTKLARPYSTTKDWDVVSILVSLDKRFVHVLGIFVVASSMRFVCTCCVRWLTPRDWACVASTRSD